MTSLKFISLAFFTMLFLSADIQSQDKVWTGAVDSSWHTAANWSPSGVPSSSQTVTIRNNTTPRPVITTNVTVRSITINQWWSNPADELTIRNNSTLTITDDLNIYGNGQLNIVNGHVEMTATSSGPNNFDMNGSPVVEITEGSFTAGTVSEDLDVEVNGFIYVGNGDFTINGDLDVSSSRYFFTENGNVTVNGTTIVNGTYNGDDGTTNFNGDVDVRSGGVLNLDSGTINFNSPTYIGNNGTVNFGSGEANFTDDINVSSGGYFNVEDADVTVTGDATFSSNGNMTVDSGSINIGGNASLSSGGTIDLNSGNLNVGGDASFTSGGVVNAGDATITLEGDFTVQNGSNFASDSSTVVFSGDSTQTINTNGDVTFYNVQVDSGAVFNTDGGSQNTVTIEGDLIVDEDGGVIVEDDDQLEVQGEVGGGGSDNVNSPAPYAISATAPDVNTVVITFNKAMVESLAETISNYSIERLSGGGALTISSATLNTGVDSSVVTLSVSTITEDVKYEITMNNLESADGGILATDYRKRFTKFGTVTLYSRTSGDWATNSTWSRVSHSGPAATLNPSTTTGAIIIVGDGDVVTISSTADITSQNSVSVVAGSTLRVGSGGSLTTGTSTITGTGTFQITTGTLEIGSPDGISASGSTGNIRTTTRSFGTNGSYVYNGTTAQSTGTGLPSSVDNLTINNTAGVRHSNDIEVTGTLNLTAGTFTLASGNNLIANTKSVGSGDLLLEHTISGSNGWRLLSSPISSTYNDFLDSIVTQGYTGAFYSTESNPGDTLQPNVLYYDETYPGTDNQRWRAPASASTAVTEGRGLYTYIFGDIAVDPLYNNTLPITMTVQGQEHEGPIDLNVTYTTSADSGWNLVGNPYAATIDWDDTGNWTKSNMDNTIYVWDYSTNQYLTWNGTTGSLGDGLIAPFQGFWVKANASTPSLIVDEDAKTNGGTFVGKQNTREVTSHPNFSITLANDRIESSTHFMFTQGASLEKDEDDAFKLLPLPGIGDYIEFSSVTSEGEKFAINNLPRHFGIPIEIPLQVEAYQNGYAASQALNITFEEFDHIPAGWDIYLIDKAVNREIKIQEGSVYPFEYHPSDKKIAPNLMKSANPKVTSKVSSSSRFILRIEPGDDASDLPDSFEMPQNYPNPFNPQTKIEFSLPIQSQARLTIYNLLGQPVATLVNEELYAGTHTFSWDASRFASGVYIYRLVTNQGVITKKMTLIK